MTKIEYFGKSLLIDKKIAVVGDLHLGFEQVMRDSGIFVLVDIVNEIKSDIENLFNEIGNVEKVVLLGDLKHEFGKISMDERKEIGEIMNLLRRKSKEIIVIKGNHDVITNYLIDELKNVEFVDYYLYGDKNKIAFVHGDKDFPEINDKDVKNWVMGHGHPAIVLEHGPKKEKYKCFLEGKFKDKKIIVVPSFFSFNEGTDVLGGYSLGLAWDFDFNKFDIKIVQEDSLKILDFGKLKKIN